MNYTFLDRGNDDPIRFAWVEGDNVDVLWTGNSIDEWLDWAPTHSDFDDDWMQGQDGYILSDSGANSDVFWGIQALMFLGDQFNYASVIAEIEDNGAGITIVTTSGYWDNNGEANDSGYDNNGKVITWNTEVDNWNVWYPGRNLQWYEFHPLLMLVHELTHAYDDITGASIAEQTFLDSEYEATAIENLFRWQFFTKIDNTMAPRPAYGMSDVDPRNFPNADLSGNHPDISWDRYWGTGGQAPWVLLP